VVEVSVGLKTHPHVWVICLCRRACTSLA
jgi:hypothetical protein